MSEDEAGQRLRSALDTIDAVTKATGGKTDHNFRNYTIARNILHEELGYFGERRAPYNLDADTRDILIVHGRQDAAHALTNTVTLLDQVTDAVRTVTALKIMVGLNMAFSLLLLVSRW